MEKVQQICDKEETNPSTLVRRLLIKEIKK